MSLGQRLGRWDSQVPLPKSQVKSPVPIVHFADVSAATARVRHSESRQVNMS